MEHWEYSEVEKVDEHITHIMFDMCQDCRYFAAMRAIDSMDIRFVEELRDYMEDERLGYNESEPTYHPDPQPKHRQGGCFAHCQEETW
jgi:hypothetical protein